MAQVPTLDNFDQVASPGPNVAAADAPVRNTAGVALEQQGAALENAGSAFGEIARAQQDKANQIRVDDAINQLSSTKSDLTYDPSSGYSQLKGIDAIQRPNGQSLAQEYGQKLQDSASEIGASLSNDAQRAAFARAAGNMQASFHGELQAHASTQFTNYAVSVRDGTIANSQDDLARNYADPVAVSRNIKAIYQSEMDKAQLTGMSPEAAEANARMAQSSALTTAATAALQNNDLATAKAIMATHGKDMQAADALRVQEQITKQNDAAAGQAAGIAAFQTPGASGTSVATNLYPDAFTRLRNLAGDPGALAGAVQKVESNNNPNAVSKAGATGLMQVMPATAANPGHGIAPSNGTAEDTARVGRQLLQALVQKYNGDTVHALWAYNWGEGNVDSFLKTGHGVNGQPMPAETQQYANKVYAAYKGGGGAPDATQHGPLLAPAFAAIDARTDLSPEAKKIAYDTVKERYAAAKDDYETTTNGAVGGAYRAIVQNGGTIDPQTYSQIPDAKLPEVINFAKSYQEAVRNPKVKSDPQVYGETRQAIADGKITNPDSLLPLAKDLSPEDLKDLQNKVVETTSANPARKAYDTVANAGLTSMRAPLIAAGINPSPKPDDAEGAAKLAQFHDAYYRQLDILQHVRGPTKPISSDDARGIITGLLADTGLGGSSGWFSSTPSKRGFELSASPGNTPTLGVASIPADVRARITVYLRAKGLPPTAFNIQHTYAMLGDQR